MEASTSFKAAITLPSLDNKKIDINVQKGQNVKDLVYHLTQHHAIPPYLTNSLYSSIVSIMSETCEKDTLYNQKKHTSNKQELRQRFMDAYQSNTLQYNNKPEEDIFPRAYHTLVHCPVAHIFDTLLELEQSYAIAIQELQTASDHELVAIQARQAQEIESASNTSSTSLSTGGTTSPQLNQPSTNNSNMTTIFTRQVEEMEVFQATWQSDILQTQQTQRQEYREFVIELYREYQTRLASLSDEQHLKPEDTLAVAEKKLDGKEMVTAAASRVRQWEENTASKSMRSSSTNSVGRRSRTGSLASSLNSNPSGNLSPNELATIVRTASLSESTETLASIKSIQEMGFQKEQAESAYILSNQNLESAIALLLEHPEKVNAYMAEKTLQQQQWQQQQQFQSMPLPPASSSTPYRRSHSLSQVPRPTIPTSPSSNSSHNRHHSTNEGKPRRHSFQRFTSTPAFLSVLNNNNKSQSQPLLQQQQQQQQQQQPKSWNPISFLQQQKQAMENTNLSSVRKLGGWLGKAMENLGIEEEAAAAAAASAKSKLLLRQQPQQPQQQQLVESFTIMMGTAQIKSSHNLRLLVTDEATEVFHPIYDPSREMAYCAETATKLYTSHLSAAIVLVDIQELLKKGWRHYKTGKGSNKALFERCQQSTEFHFPDMEHQLSVIEQDFGEGGLMEGSFFVTKHSNLPSTQVVFHLLIDSTGVSGEISTRHPLIIGLRNILKMTSYYDISSLSIPLLLLPEQYTERVDQHMTWLSKRGEVVMKCVKGFLIENSRNNNKTRHDRESIGSGGMRNVEFLLPINPAIYTVDGSSPSEVTETGIHHEVEMTFQQFRSLLVHLFRTS